MAVTIGQLYVDLAANTASFAKDLGKAQESLNSFRTGANKALAAVSNTFSKFGNDIKRSVSSVFTLKGAIGILAGASGLGLLVKKSFDAAEALVKVADRVGISTRALQEYHYAAMVSNTSTEAFDDALQKFTVNAGLAAAGTGKALGTFKALKIEFADGAGRLKTTNTLFQEAADKLSKIVNPADRARMAYKLFGDQGLELLDMLKNGKAGLEAFAAEANKLGLVVDDALIRKAEEAGDKFAVFAKVMETKLFVAVVENAETLGRFADSLTNCIPLVVKLGTVITEVATFFLDVKTRVKEVGLLFMGLFNIWLTVGKAVLQWPVMAVNAFLAGFRKIGAIMKGFAKDYWTYLKSFGKSTSNFAEQAMDTGVIEEMKKEWDSWGAAMQDTVDAAWNGYDKFRDEITGKANPAIVKSSETAAGKIEEAYVGSLDDVVKATTKSTKKVKEEIDKNAKAVENIMEHMAENIHDTMSDALFGMIRNMDFDMKTVMSGIKDTFARGLSEMISFAASNAVTIPVVTAASGGVAGAANAATGGMTGDGSMLSGASNLWNLVKGGLDAPLFSSGSLIGTGINKLGSMFGFGQLGSGISGAPMPLTSAFTGGAALGGFGGNFLANALFGDRGIGASIGGTAGGIAGTILTMGNPLGALVGSFLGNALGGLFGGKKPSDKTQGGTFNLSKNIVTDRRGLDGKKFSQENYDAVTGLMEFAKQVSASVGGSKGALGFVVGNRDGNRLWSTDGTKPATEQNFGNKPEEMLKAATKFIAENAISGVNKSLLKAADKIDFKKIDQAISDINFAAAFENIDQAPKKISEFEASLNELTRQYNEALATTRRLGLEEQKLKNARIDQLRTLRREFNQSIVDQILAITDPMKLALKQLDAEFEQIRADAKLIGANLATIEKLYGLKREEIVKQYQTNITDTMVQTYRTTKEAIKNFADEIRIDETLGGLSKQARLTEAQRQFANAQAGYNTSTGAGFEEVQRTTNNLLGAARDWFGLTSSFYSIQSNVLKYLDRIAAIAPSAPQAFAAGGDTKGGIIQVGETGTELMAIGTQARIMNSQRTRAIMNDGNPELLAEIQNLNDNISGLRNQQRAENEQGVKLSARETERLIRTQKRLARRRK